MKWTLDEDHVVDFWLKGLKDDVELPATTCALINHKFSVRLEWTQWLEAHLEYQRVIRAKEAVASLLKEYRTLNKALVLRILDIELIAERVSVTEVVEARKNDS